MVVDLSRFENTNTLQKRAWVFALSLFVIVVVAIGGTSDPEALPAFILRFSSITMIIAGLIRLGFIAPSRAAAEGFGILLLIVGLVLLQLFPLPPFIWTSLPGREFVVHGLRASGTELGWMPLSLSPPQTRLALLALLPPIAAFLAGLTLRTSERWMIVAVILGCILASLLLGFAQKFQGPTSSLYFYEETNLGSAVGTFANRNFFAALLYCAIPLTWALALRAIRERWANQYVIGAFASVVLLSVILGLATAGSRAGILLSMVALLASATLGFGGQSSTQHRSQSRWAIIAAFVALVLIGQFGMVAILRLAELDPVSDYRTLMSGMTFRAAWSYFPFGSGFGTFVPIYAMHELPDTIMRTYVNHAHNDWAELWLEGGLPAALILSAFLAWYGVNLFRLWRPRENLEGVMLARAGAILCGLLMLHSLVDYPLREPALAVVFGLACAFIASVPAGRSDARRYARAHRHQSGRDSSPPEVRMGK